uniref:Putative secreted peptide n=1 Tax=Anopheles braziliensis TaxID=58242 RepID=A0A2M3ZMM9_9DIPT
MRTSLLFYFPTSSLLVCFHPIIHTFHTHSRDACTQTRTHFVFGGKEDPERSCSLGWICRSKNKMGDGKRKRNVL